MTRKSSTRATTENTWMAQDAKARFSEVMRRAREIGPQHVTVHGRDEAVVISAEEYRKLRGDRRTGADLIAAMQTFPGGDDVDLEPERFPMPVREVDFP
jgi:prevent-host-death family protein